MTNIDTYQQQVEAKLKEYSAEIEKLKAEANETTPETRLKYQQQVEALSARQQDVQTQLQQLNQASGENWEELKQELDQELMSLEESVERARAELQQTDRERLGWAEGMAQKRAHDSEGWAEGLGHQEENSEGWVEGMGHQEQDSRGWPQGMNQHANVVEKRMDMILGDNLIDKLVISSNEGRIVGKVKEFYLDKALEAVTAVQLAGEGFFNLSGGGLFQRKFTLIKHEDITLLGVDAVLVKDADRVIDSDQVTELDTWISRHELRGREVATPGGTKIGTIGDIIFNQAGRLLAFTLSRIFVEGPLANTQTIAREVIVDLGHEEGIITIDLAAAEQQNLSLASIAD